MLTCLFEQPQQMTKPVNLEAVRQPPILQTKHPNPQKERAMSLLAYEFVQMPGRVRELRPRESGW